MDGGISCLVLLFSWYFVWIGISDAILYLYPLSGYVLHAICLKSTHGRSASMYMRSALLVRVHGK
ncbi:hypothetical protein DM02DRAFT_304685 [Periconia macrospinosa]|uniref:Uncharacterized protein n=1 Tax=Periconia macrospinosa TaxID=97972 RepID=A0A2V1DW07_9PLEO|nr:hypothetical protein DM02DRAFT_304685 [Periconia macrospinosa]